MYYTTGFVQEIDNSSCSHGVLAHKSQDHGSVAATLDLDNMVDDNNTDVSAEEAAAEPPACEAFEYTIKPFTPDFEAQITDDLGRTVQYHGGQRFCEDLNSAVLGHKDLSQYATSP